MKLGTRLSFAVPGMRAGWIFTYMVLVIDYSMNDVCTVVKIPTGRVLEKVGSTWIGFICGHQTALFLDYLCLYLFNQPIKQFLYGHD